MKSKNYGQPESHPYIIRNIQIPSSSQFYKYEPYRLSENFILNDQIIIALGNNNVTSLWELGLIDPIHTNKEVITIQGKNGFFNTPILNEQIIPQIYLSEIKKELGTLVLEITINLKQSLTIAKMLRS